MVPRFLSPALSWCYAIARGRQKPAGRADLYSASRQDIHSGHTKTRSQRQLRSGPSCCFLSCPLAPVIHPGIVTPNTGSPPPVNDILNIHRRDVIGTAQGGFGVSSAQETVAVIGGILAMVTGVILTVVATLNYRLERAKKDEASRSHLSAVHAADDLAHAVQSQWEDEESRRRIRDPFPLSVRWSTAPEELFDHWPNILQVPPGTLSSPLDLADHLENVLDTFDRIPSGRLVILGKAGSGKTILAMRFVLNFLARRGEDDPV